MRQRGEGVAIVLCSPAIGRRVIRSGISVEVRWRSQCTSSVEPPSVQSVADGFLSRGGLVVHTCRPGA